MGPKKKKGGKKKAAGSAKKKKDVGETVTFKEAVMIYQLEVKQAQLNEVKEDIEDLKFRNNKQKNRNQFLKQEQNRHIKDVIEQARQHEKEVGKQKKTPYEDVEKALYKKRDTINAEMDNIKGIQENITGLEEEISNLQKELKELKLYKERGQYTDKTHIEVLKKEMEEMVKSFDEMSDFFDKSLSTIKATILKKSEENIINHKKLASECAIHNLDERTEQEFLDNKWLLKEVQIHRQHISNTTLEVEVYEKENMNLISELFEKQLSDINDTRKFYLTCKEEDEKDLETYSKPLALLDKKSHGKEEIISESNNKEFIVEEVPDDLKWLDNYLPDYEVANSEECYKLGGLEMNLLCIIGKQVVIHNMDDDSSMANDDKDKVFRRFHVEREEITRITDHSFTSLS